MLLQSAQDSVMMASVMGAVAVGSKISLHYIFKSLPIDTVHSSVDNILQLTSTFAIISMASSLLRYYQTIRRGENEQVASQELRRSLLVAMAEFAAFSAIGVGVDFLQDYLVGTLLDSVLPDPTFIVIGLRVLWNIGELFFNVVGNYENKKAVELCMRIRKDDMYRRALG
jgi:ABC-type multidrug transport system fused ATPase/permease subunit